MSLLEVNIICVHVASYKFEYRVLCNKSLISNAQETHSIILDLVLVVCQSLVYISSRSREDWR